MVKNSEFLVFMEAKRFIRGPCQGINASDGTQMRRSMLSELDKVKHTTHPNVHA